MKIRDFIRSLYSQLPYECNDSFYSFSKEKLKLFIETLNKDIDNDDLQILEKSTFFKGSCTKIRLRNCLKKINNVFLDILALCFKGDLYGALSSLKSLLFGRKFSRYLVEAYVSYMEFNINEDNSFLRMRDENIKDKDGNELL